MVNSLRWEGMEEGQISNGFSGGKGLLSSGGVDRKEREFYGENSILLAGRSYNNQSLRKMKSFVFILLALGCFLQLMRTANYMNLCS